MSMVKYAWRFVHGQGSDGTCLSAASYHTINYNEPRFSYLNTMHTEIIQYRSCHGFMATVMAHKRSSKFRDAVNSFIVPGIDEIGPRTDL